MLLYYILFISTYSIFACFFLKVLWHNMPRFHCIHSYVCCSTAIISSLYMACGEIFLSLQGADHPHLAETPCRCHGGYVAAASRCIRLCRCWQLVPPTSAERRICLQRWRLMSRLGRFLTTSQCGFFRLHFGFLTCNWDKMMSSCSVFWLVNFYR